MTTKFDGTALKKTRLDFGISQSELSRRTGVNQSVISKMERGAIPNPSYEKLIPMADVLNITVDDFNLKPDTVSAGVKKGNETKWTLSKQEVETIIQRLKDIAPAVASSQNKDQKITVDLNFNIKLSGS